MAPDTDVVPKDTRATSMTAIGARIADVLQPMSCEASRRTFTRGRRRPELLLGVVVAFHLLISGTAGLGGRRLDA